MVIGLELIKMIKVYDYWGCSWAGEGEEGGSNRSYQSRRVVVWRIDTRQMLVLLASPSGRWREALVECSHSVFVKKN
jgi:hypothetical protein